MYALDLKGFGSNAGMEFPYSLSDYVNEVREYMKENAIVRPFVIAHSFGARIAIKLAAEDSRAFLKIALCGAAGLKPRFSLKKACKCTVFKVLKRVVKRERLQKFYSKDYQSLSPVMKESFVKIVNERLETAAERIETPTVLIFGDKDGETPVYMGRAYNKRIRGSKLYIIKGAGHFAFVDRPREFCEIIREFFSE